MNRRQFLSTSVAASLGTTALLAEERAEPFRKIKIAQIGVRHEHASGKITSLKLLPDYYEIVGIAAESPEWEKKYKNASCYSGLEWKSQEELLATPGLEAVAVETEMTELIPTAKRCAELGLHMHVDKPLGQNLDECRELFDVCQTHGVVMQPGYMFRTNQAFRLAIKAVQNGWLGEIHDVRANMNRNDVDPDFRRWLATYRGGGMYDFGSHLIDFVVEMLGAPNEISVFERPDPDGLSDNTLSVLLYDKAIVNLRVTERAIDGFQNRCLSIIGSKGSFQLLPLEDFSRDPQTGKTVPLNVRLTLAEGNDEYERGTHHLQIDPFEDRYIGQLIDLAKFIRGEKNNPYTFEHELLVQKTILAASGYIPWTR
ncbi:MAG: Gfo/Idh/MocA family oxidoreductase [Thermoguttaceae bacterium]|nr:Gfo/Idh/MocA family oxidoreductase [Thermoguttaceae bacterium]